MADTRTYRSDPKTGRAETSGYGAERSQAEVESSAETRSQKVEPRSVLADLAKQKKASPPPPGSESPLARAARLQKEAMAKKKQ